MNELLVISAIAQGIATLLLVFITWRYTLFTKRLVDLQIEPRVDFEIPANALGRPSAPARIVNNSRCEVDSIHLQVAYQFRLKDGRPTNIMKCIDTKSWKQRLRPGQAMEFEIADYFNVATELAAEYDMPAGMELIRGAVVFGVSFRRTVDGREFCFEEPYRVIPSDSGQSSVSKTGPRGSVSSLDKEILRPVFASEARSVPGDY